MKNVTSKPEPSHPAIVSNSHLFDDWFDPIEDMIRGQVRGLIEEMIRGELDATLSRPRYGRLSGHSEGSDLTAVVTGHRHGSRVRTLTGTFGKTEIAVPRARLNGSGGKTTEWKSQVLRNYQRRTRAADALIAGAYLAGTNTRRVRRALRSVFGGEVGTPIGHHRPRSQLLWNLHGKSKDDHRAPSCHACCALQKSRHE
jgi:putative transposase